MSSADRQGFQGTGTPFIQPRHWVVHHPIFTKHPKAMVVYMRLRTAFYEGDDQIRVMTNEQIAQLVDLPVSTVRDGLRHLTQAGLLIRTNPEKKNAIPVRCFVDELPQDYRGVTNGLRHRDQILEGATQRNASDKSGNLGDGSATPPPGQELFPEEEISTVTEKLENRTRGSDQQFFRGGNNEPDNREFLGDGSSTPGDGSSTPGADLPSPQGGKTAGHSGGAGRQEATKQEATPEETLSPASPENARTRESESGERPSIEEITGAGAVVAFADRGRHTHRPPAHCTCGVCPPAVPQQQSAENSWLDDLDWTGLK